MPDGYKNGKPDVGYWLKQIRHGLRFRKESAFEQKWETWRKQYRGMWRSDILPSPIFFKMIRSTVPRIYFRNPSISVVPSLPGIENAIMAKLLERTDNKLLRTMKVKKQMKRIVQDTWMYGTGIGKKGFGSEYQATPEPLGTTTPIDSSKLTSKMKNRVEYNFDVQANMPWFFRTHPKNFVVPRGTIYIEDARWVAFIFERDVEDVKADPRFKNTKNLGIGNVTEEVGGVRRTFNTIENLTQLIEVHDKKTGMVFVITPTLTDKVILFEQSEFDDLRINVASTTTFNDDGDVFWGIPDAQILDPLAREMNEIKTYMMYHRRLSIARLLYKKGSITEDQLQKLVGPDVLPAVEVSDPQMDIKVMESADIPDGLVKAEMSLLGDIRESLGFSRNEAGEYKEGSRSPTATEAQIVKMASEIRLDERRDMIADMLVETVQDYHPIIFNHWTNEQVEEIIGPGGIPFWITFKPRMLSRINYTVKVDPDQSIPETKEARESKALLLYRELKLNPLIDPYKLTSYLLRELHGVQFDDMIRGLGNMGLTPDHPLSIGQFSNVLQTIGREAPQLLMGPQVTQTEADEI